jgi:hypothetical protein
MLRLLKPSTLAQKRTLTTKSARAVAYVQCDLFIANFERHTPWGSFSYRVGVGRWSDRSKPRKGLFAFIYVQVYMRRRTRLNPMTGKMVVCHRGGGYGPDTPLSSTVKPEPARPPASPRTLYSNQIPRRRDVYVQLFLAFGSSDQHDFPACSVSALPVFPLSANSDSFLVGTCSETDCHVFRPYHSKSDSSRVESNGFYPEAPKLLVPTHR